MNGKPFSSQYAVHPHLRGAYAALPRQQLIFPGSSPHTWGIPLLGLRMLLPDRFIPTHVGHTQDRAGMSTPRSVHPHIRGACIQPDPAVHFQPGSSPHTWGIRPNHGNPTSTPGSSPHTWGILLTDPIIRQAYRFIPTYVGHTFSEGKNGEADNGSSPHTWGIQLFRLGLVHKPRFIPTYVGHTCSMGIPGKMGSVHPHIRGAYSKGWTTPALCRGSSPHTWGILGQIPGKIASLRFIPTYVGHTPG